MDNGILSYRKVELKYQRNAMPALHQISFTVNEGEFIAILGSSGSGKTTLIKLANRLLEPSGGEVLFEGRNVKELDLLKLRRRFGYVIQQTGLFPHMTIEDNIGITAKIMGWDRERRKRRTQELLALAKLPDTEDFRRRHPWQLSGGQQQRVGLARALYADPKVLLMDEPFGALDALTRKELQRELLNIHEKYRNTILFVTHDLQEAVSLGDKVLVLNEGRIEQYDTPKKLILEPANAFIRELFHAATPVEKLLYFRVKDFQELLRLDGKPDASGLDWEDPMERAVNSILLGADKIAVYKEGEYRGYFLSRDLSRIGEGR